MDQVCTFGQVPMFLTFDARQALSDGDARGVGELMVEAQTIFDRLVAPACPVELAAPKLHRVLEYSPLQELVWGGKGVGSQGDGTARLLTCGSEERLRAQSILKDDLGLECLSLTLTSPQVK